MKYKFNYQMKAYDLWRFSLEKMYHSMVGVCNLVFTVTMIFVTIKFWENTLPIKLLLILGCALFTVIQPTVIYRRAMKQVESFPKGMEICFDEKGMHMYSKGQCSDLKWNQMKGISKKKDMLILYTTAHQGLILSNDVLGEQKEALFRDIISKLSLNQ